MTSPSPADLRRLHDDATVIDLHAHPSMKTYFGSAKLKTRQPATSGFHLTRLRTSHPSLVAGGVDLLCSSVVVPERDLQSDCWVIAVGGRIISKLGRAFANEPDVIALEMLNHVELEIADVNASSPARPMTVVKSNQELDAALQRGDLAVAHTIEGAHALGRNAGNVGVFKAKGVCSITLGHFYENGVSPPVDGIPDDFLLKRMGCFKKHEDLSKGLPLPLGADVVEEMFNLGVVVDLTHSTPKARSDVLALPNPRNRPIVFTHVGVRDQKDHPMNATAAEIRTVAAGGGVVGVIFYSYWLTAEDYRKNRSDDLRHVVKTVRDLVNTGGEDCVAFGSDFDGMTDPPDDLREPADWPNLTVALAAAGFDDSQIRKFLGGNARRVLLDGWQ